MRKRLWSPDEDEKLQKYVSQHGFGNWSEVAKKTGLQRCGKSCRLRWINYLRPDLKRGKFSAEEKLIIVNLQKVFGNSWSKIAAHLPGRTDSDIKNFWHSHFRKKRPQQFLTTASLHNPNLPSFPLHNPNLPPPPSLLNPNSFSSAFSSFPSSSSSSSSYLHHHPLFTPPPSADSISRHHPNSSLSSSTPNSSLSINPLSTHNLSISQNPNLSLAPANTSPSLALPPHIAAPPPPFSSCSSNLISASHGGLCPKQESNFFQLMNQQISSILQEPTMADNDAEEIDLFTNKEEDEEEDENEEGALLGNDFELMGSLCHHAATWYNGNKVRDRVTTSGATVESTRPMETNIMGSSCTTMGSKEENNTLQMLNMYEASSHHGSNVHVGGPPPPAPPEGLDLVVWSCVNRPSQLDQEELLPPHLALASNMHNMSLSLHEHAHEFLELES